MRARSRADASRTSDGRTIDEWRVNVPGGGAEKVTIRMISGPDGFRFTARGSGIMSGLALEASDLNALKALVDKDLTARARLVAAEEWVEGEMIEVKAVSRALPARGCLQPSTEVSIDMRSSRVLMNAGVPAGNDGTLVIDRGKGPVRVRTGAASDARDEDLRLSDRKSVAFVPERDLDALRAFQAAVARLGELLEARMAPIELRDRGMPDPSELAEMAEEAARTAAPIEEADDNQFLI